VSARGCASGPADGYMMQAEQARKAGAWGHRLGRTGLRSGRRQVVSAGWRWAGESQQKAEPQGQPAGVPRELSQITNLPFHFNRN